MYRIINTEKAIDMSVPIKIASHLLFLTSLLGIVCFVIYFFIPNCLVSLMPSLFFILQERRWYVNRRHYLHALFLIVSAAYGNSQVYTKVVRMVNIGRYNQRGSPGLRSLKSTAYIIPVNMIPKNHSPVDLKSPASGSINTA